MPTMEELTDAAAEGDLVAVQKLVGQVSVDGKEEALRRAAENGHLAVVTHLIKECAIEVDARDGNEDTALMLAANNGHVDVVEYLAEQCGADANAVNSWGETAFRRTVENGHVEVVRYLVKQCGAAVDSRGDSALMLAAKEDHVGVVRFLVEQCGADVNAKDSYGATALSLAAESGHIAVVQYLAEQCGADVNIRNDYGETGFLSAAKRGHIDIVRHLAEQCSANVNAKSDRDMTALMWAAGSGHIDVVRYLVEHCGANANANAKDNEGDTALIHAGGFGYSDIVRYLAEQCGVDANATDELGYTALIWAAENGHVDVVRCLGGRCGVDVNAKTDDGYTALMKAAVRGYIEIVRYLTEHCAVDVNEKLDGKYTALMLAAETGEATVVEYLAGQGADLNAHDDCGYTALMKAAENGHEGIVECLAVQYRAGVNAKSFSGSTALRLAAERGYEEIQRVLMPLVLPDSTDRTTLPKVVVELPPNCSIDPSEVELTLYSQNGRIGGDFQAKWLDADAVVKFFIPDASHSSFGDEVRMWQQLRHPNVLKMYGACDAGHHLLFFVCEYACQGSLLEHVKSSSVETQTMWKYLYEAALGLEYLHERGLVHGDLRCSNILIGSDGMANLSNFGLSGSIKASTAVSDSIVRSMRWQAPEVVEGAPPMFESDVYSLGMCILESVTREEPWGEATEEQTKMEKLNWATDDELYAEFRPYCPQGDAHELVWEMCCQDPHKRASLSSVVYKLERLAAKENSGASQPEQEPLCSFEEYALGKVQEAWLRLETYMQKCDNSEYCATFDQLKSLHERLRVSTHRPALLERFHALVTEFYQTVKMSPDQALMMRLSSTRATSNSLHALQWRIESLMASLGGAVEGISDTMESGWQQQRPDETKLLVSGVSDMFLLLQKLKTTEERAAYLKTLKAEIETPLDKYRFGPSPEKQGYCDVSSRSRHLVWLQPPSRHSALWRLSRRTAVLRM